MCGGWWNSDIGTDCELLFCVVASTYLPKKDVSLVSRYLLSAVSDGQRICY